MISIRPIRVLCMSTILTAFLLATLPGNAMAQARGAPEQAATRSLNFAAQQEKINAWTVGLAAGLIEGAPLRLASEMARGDSLNA